MRITDAEALYVYRRRLGLNQAEMAEEFGLKEWLYVEYENDRRVAPKGLVRKMHKLSELEEFVLKRRRDNMTQEDLAAELGCTRVWVNYMESGSRNPEALREYWRNRR